MAEQIENRPPTQSQNPKAFSGSMPNAATLSRAVETATKCLATAAARATSVSWMALELRSLFHSHSLANRAFVSVSRVPNVLDATMKRVVSGSRSAVFS